MARRPLAQNEEGQEWPYRRTQCRRRRYGHLLLQSGEQQFGRLHRLERVRRVLLERRQSARLTMAPIAKKNASQIGGNEVQVFAVTKTVFSAELTGGFSGGIGFDV